MKPPCNNILSGEWTELRHIWRGHGQLIGCLEIQIQFRFVVPFQKRARAEYRGQI